jgi:hypothetical protein
MLSLMVRKGFRVVEAPCTACVVTMVTRGMTLEIILMFISGL